MRAMLQSIFLLGTLTGSIIFGYFADKYHFKQSQNFSRIYKSGKFETIY